MPMHPKKSSPSLAVPPSSVQIDPADILTIDELAARLKVSERWVYEKSRRRCLDPLPVFRMGRYLRFSWADISAWLQQRKTARS